MWGLIFHIHIVQIHTSEIYDRHYHIHTPTYTKIQYRQIHSLYTYNRVRDHDLIHMNIIREMKIRRNIREKRKVDIANIYRRG